MSLLAYTAAAAAVSDASNVDAFSLNGNDIFESFKLNSCKGETISNEKNDDLKLNSFRGKWSSEEVISNKIF